MRVTVTRWIRRSFNLLALPASVFLSSMASGSEGSHTLPETDSTPTSNVPLPLVSSLPLQKASSGAFAATEVHPLSCSLYPAEMRTGSQKPAFHAEIVGCIPANPSVLQPASRIEVAQLVPAPIPLPTCAELQSEITRGVRDLASTRRDDGNRKFGVQAVPQPGEISMVKWEASGQVSNGGGKIPMSKDFTVSDCPTICWANSDFGDLLPEPTKSDADRASSHLSNGDSSESVSGRALLTPISSSNGEAVPTDVMKELAVLTPSLETVSVGDTYLAELDELLQGQSNWLFGNEEIVELAPSEAEVATGNYLDELNSLASKNGHLGGNSFHTSFSRQDAGGQQSVEDPKHTPNFPIKNPYDTISAPEECCTGNSGEKTLADFFMPVAEISVTGVSTQPPSRSADDMQNLLERPVDSACQYMDNATPIAYYVPPRFGGSRPSRNTLKLCHNPLYYEDPNLERCGQSYGCLTTAVSVVHFSTAIAMTPFKMSQNCPRDCVQSLPDCPTCHEFGKDVYCSGR